MCRLPALLVACFVLLWSPAALAQVLLSFQSFNGSVIVGRYPHTFIVLEGTLEATGEPVDENYGFTAKRVTPAILNGPVEHEILIEKAKYIKSTNRHFTIPISDAQYWRIRQEVDAWRNAPGKYYDLDNRNCIHFVGRMAELVGVKVEYPKDMLRRPKAWLNHVVALNPALGAKAIR
jgi:hypothetical protein